MEIVFILAKKLPLLCWNTIFVPFFLLCECFDGNKRLCFSPGADLFAMLLNVLGKSWADTFPPYSSEVPMGMEGGCCKCTHRRELAQIGIWMGCTPWICGDTPSSGMKNDG